MGVYADIASHRKMNFDPVRNSAYLSAIRKSVTPDSVVLDLGAGLGMLGFMAAKAGARKVYLVEPEGVIEVARKVAAANGFENVECIQATAETLKLKEKPDIILSVFTGNFLLTEDLLPSLFHARDHLLAPGGTLLPDRGRIMVAPVCAPPYYRENIESWSLEQATKNGVETHGVDYRLARTYAANTLYYDTAEAFDAQLLAAPKGVMEMDFLTAARADCDHTIELSVNQAGECHGWLGWFDMRLGSEWLSTAPDAASMHWRQVFMPLEQPITLEKGQKLGFGLKRPEYGEWAWTTTHGDKQQRQSTFLSTPLTVETVRRKSDAFQPTLNERGEAMLFVLSNINGQQTTGSLADEVLRKFGRSFSSQEDSLRFVKSLVSKFA